MMECIITFYKRKGIKNQEVLTYSDKRMMKIKESFLLTLFLMLFMQSIFPQGGTRTWVKGADTANSQGVFGPKGVSGSNYNPPALVEYSGWKDKVGNLWVFGGNDGNIFNPRWGNKNDLWKFDM